ncbi:MAG: hypothetical protein ACMG6E_06385 [Candidatus Roizmanbacteria bacterium]
MKEKEMLKGFEPQQNHFEFPHLEALGECQQMSNKCFHGIFNSENLNTNMKKLDYYYQ